MRTPFNAVPTDHPRGLVQVGRIPFRSPLLGESLLISFPPLIYMLKFSGLPLTSKAQHCGERYAGRKVTHYCVGIFPLKV